MLTYKFDHNTKEFLRSEGAHLDPLEAKQQGKEVYLLPADSTFTAPLPTKDGYAVCWKDTEWEYVEDHRQRLDKGGVPIKDTGTAFWLPEDTWETPARYMKELGPLPEGATTVKPEMSKEARFERLRSERNVRIAATDFYLLADYPITEAQKEVLTAYRQALRDLPSQEGAPWDGGGELTPWPAFPDILLE